MPPKKSDTLSHYESERFIRRLRQENIPIVSTAFVRYTASKRTLNARAKELVKEIRGAAQFPLFILLNLSVTADDQKHANVIVVCPKTVAEGYDLLLFEPNGKYTEDWGEPVDHILREIQTALPGTEIHPRLLEHPINTAGGHCDALCLFFILLVGAAGLGCPLTPTTLKQATDPWLQRFEATPSQTRGKRAGTEARRILTLIRAGMSAKSTLIPLPSQKKSK